VSAHAVAAEWSLAPSGQVYSQAEQNPRFGDDDKEIVTAIGARASLQMQRRTEHLLISVQPTVGMQRYQQDTDLDRNNQDIQSKFNWQGEHVSWRGSASAARDTTLTSELGTTGFTQVNQRHESIDASMGPVWQLSERLATGATAAWERNRYPARDNSPLVGSRYSRLSTFLSYTLDERTSLTFSGSVARLDSYGPRPQTDTRSVRLQWSRVLSPYWTTSLAAGPSWARTEHGSSERGLLYSAEIARILEHASLSLSVSRGQSPSGFGLLTNVEEAAFAFSQQFSERLSGSVTIGASRRTDVLPALRADLREVRYGRADVSVAWRLNPRWQLSGGVAHTVQQAGLDAFGYDTARGYQVRLAIGWYGDAHVR